jgi:hypothetical protein
LSQPAICCGDQSNASLAATSSVNATREASFIGFGRVARDHAATSARAARYARGPPLAETSRHTVEGERPSAAAIARSDRPAARPREISSRSVNVNRSSQRRRGAGRIPPQR